MKRIAAVLLFAGVGIGLFAQEIQTLETALKSAQVQLLVHGNGSSSGSSLDGYLQNTTQRALRISIHIDDGMYLLNSGAGQNMVVMQVYLADGSYYVEGQNSFIVLEPQANTGVSLIGFCADFERENPSGGESFSVEPMPRNLRSIASHISRFMTDHGDEYNIVAIQLALWLARGEKPQAISEKFTFTEEDEALARRIMRYVRQRN
ncbi:MAG: hypothetical protein LBJ31_07895 [Treponema sp.]|jgi:hypothetical protein|nr:hypothetical protein [Treponema sp.]